MMKIPRGAKESLKFYKWKVDSRWGLVFMFQGQPPYIRLGPGVAKAANREISEMSDEEFEDLLKEFNHKDGVRLQRLRAIVREMKEEGRTDRF